MGEGGDRPQGQSRVTIGIGIVIGIVLQCHSPLRGERDERGERVSGAIGPQQGAVAWRGS
jgi:hypothetical protein